MNRGRIQIVDNFLPSPLAIRDFALRASFLPNTNSPFSCQKFPIPDAITLEILNLAVPYIGSDYISRLDKSEFSRYNAMDQFHNLQRGLWIHADRSSCIGILFLNPGVEDDDSGLAFYEHVATGAHQWSQVSSDAEAQKALSRDSADLTCWRELLHVKNTFNRMVFFDSYYFHQAKNYFGSTPEDSRLTLNIYFN